MELPRPSGVVTLLTDFGAADPYVGVMKGVLLMHHPRVEVVDLCHHVPAHRFDVGALFWSATLGRFAKGTVHVAVVDPGVGSARRAAAFCAADCYWIAPDNGVISRVLAAAAMFEARQLDLAALGLREPSATFWGRDVFAPAAAMLAGARFGFRALGPLLRDPVRLPAPAAVVLAVDHFGNLLTGITAKQLADRGVREVEVAGRRVPLCRTYADVAPGMVLALVNSYEMLEVAVCQGRASDVLAVGPGAAVTLHGTQS